MIRRPVRINEIRTLELIRLGNEGGDSTPHNFVQHQRRETHRMSHLSDTPLSVTDGPSLQRYVMYEVTRFGDLMLVVVGESRCISK